MYLFSTLYSSSLYFEDHRAVVNEKGDLFDLTAGLEKPSMQDSFFYDSFIQNPANLELYIRANILSSDKNINELTMLYDKLLKTRPTWPYYFSGLAQLNQISNVFDSGIIESAIQYGRFERKVVYSFAEILFHNWIKLQKR